MSKESPEFVENRLVNYTEAEYCTQTVDNNRVRYVLTFTNEIGWMWVYGQVQKLNEELTVDLELYEIEPGVGTCFDLVVREIDRREGIDDDQIDLAAFE